MKQRFKKIIINNWLFIFMLVAIQLKSMLLLSMLRTPESSSLGEIYFGQPSKISHIAIITLILSVICLFKNKGKLKAAVIIDVIITILFISDIWYYRNNGTFLSIRHILHPEIFNPIGESLFNFKIIDLLFLIDFIILFLLHKFIKFKNSTGNLDLSFKLRLMMFSLIFIISAGVIGINHYYIDVKGEFPSKALFRLSWAPFQSFSDMSPLGYHGYDLIYYKDKTKKLTNDDIAEIKAWINYNKENIPDNKYKGMFKGKNVIAIQVESLENFVLNQKVYGQEITPTLNKLLSQSIYFNNIYEQNNSGTSSDADLMVNASIFPLRSSSTFLSNPWTSYNTIQDILKNKGYTSISSHAELPGSWNWAEPHKSFNADKLWDIRCFNEDEIIGLGLSDESYLRQMAEKLKSEKTPFYAFMATLTSHGPFDMPEDKKMLKLPKELDDNILGGYFQSIRYTDEAIKKFIEELDKNGVLDNTVLMIYGDHCGVHKFYEDEMKNVHLEGDWWKENNKKIPYILYSKGTEEEVISKAGGQVDFLPTICYLLGVDREKIDNTAMGRILVNTERNATILNNGEIMGTPKNEEETKHLKDAFKVADLIIQGDYFYNKK